MSMSFTRTSAAAALLVLAACGKNASEATETEDVAAPAESEATETGTETAALDAFPAPPPNPLIAKNLERAEAFLAENAARDGVRVFENGLQIETTTPGTGEFAQPTDIVRFHYAGKFIGGEIFEDSRVLGEPLVIPTFTQIPVPGLSDAIAQMKEGEQATVYVPPALAFGEKGVPGLFEPNTVLVFDVELVELVTEAEEDRRAEVIAEQERLMAEARAADEAERAAAAAERQTVANENAAASATFLAETATRAGVTVTSTGLQYEVVEDGGTGATPDPWDTVEVHYRGTLPDGTEFDSSYSRGETIEFPLNGVIKGWTEGVGLMNVGDTYRFYIPAELGYGERGAGGLIGPNQALVFDVELLGITEGTPPAGAE